MFFDGVLMVFWCLVKDPLFLKVLDGSLVLLSSAVQQKTTLVFVQHKVCSVGSLHKCSEYQCLKHNNSESAPEVGQHNQRFFKKV